MIDLLAADLRRITWRSMSLVIAIVTVIVIVAVGIVDFHHTAKHPFDVRTGVPNAFATFSGPARTRGVRLRCVIARGRLHQPFLDHFAHVGATPRSGALFAGGDLCGVHVLRSTRRDGSVGVGTAAISPCPYNGSRHCLRVGGCSRDSDSAAGSRGLRDRACRSQLSAAAQPPL